MTEPVTADRLFALSLWQPWASLWLTDAKLHETRHWPTKHRGLLYVHAAKRPFRRSELSDELDRICVAQFGADYRTKLPFGAMIGIVDLVDCIQTERVRWPDNHDDAHCGDFSDGRYAWKRGPRPVHIGPWPYRGMQGIFRCDDLGDVANKVLGVA